MINMYFDRYSRFNPDKWVWSLWPGIHSHSYGDEARENQERYMKFRARRSDSRGSEKYEDRDIVPPDFYSVERDAAQFGLNEVTVEDFFGIKWTGSKGKHETVYAPDYEGHLYYWPKGEESEYYEDDEPAVSDEYTDRAPPPAEIYYPMERGHPHFDYIWVNIRDIVSAAYKYQVCNHLFKYTRIEVKFADGEEMSFYEGDCYSQLLSAFKKLGKEEIVKEIFAEMNLHFNALRDSERDENRKFWPGKTAEEYFEESLKEK